MLKYDKVIRIVLDSEMFYARVSPNLNELWTDYNDLLDMPRIYHFLNIYFSKELEALKNKEIDYIALSSDL